MLAHLLIVNNRSALKRCSEILQFHLWPFRKMSFMIGPGGNFGWPKHQTTIKFSYLALPGPKSLMDCKNIFPLLYYEWRRADSHCFCYCCRKTNDSKILSRCIKILGKKSAATKNRSLIKISKLSKKSPLFLAKWFDEKTVKREFFGHFFVRHGIF